MNDRLAAERHLLARRKSLAVSQAARMPTVSAAELQADREAATERGGYVDRSLAKIKSSESSFELGLGTPVLCCALSVQRECQLRSIPKCLMRCL